jgi:hypothetical protein
MERFLSPSPSASRPPSAMSEEEMEPLIPEQSQPSASGEQQPKILEYIGFFYGASKEKGKLKCQVKWCNKVISYSANSYYNLKSHYQKQHPKKLPDFQAALSSGSKRGRHPSGAR